MLWPILSVARTAPAGLEVYRSNEYYSKEEDFVFALAEALREEYNVIVESGIILQVDDAWYVVEYPELVSQRIQRFAALLGKENVIAGADCGFGGRTHPQIAWAKLQSLVEGAKLATAALW
jgi:methionine synthase II (cobalamin-independent)